MVPFGFDQMAGHRPRWIVLKIIHILCLNLVNNFTLYEKALFGLASRD